MVKKIYHFFKYDIWRIRIRDLSRPKYFLFRIIRIFVLSLREFDEDKCQLRASALTFFTLLSIVPILAMAFGIAKGFGFQNRLESIIAEKLEGQEEVATRIIEFSTTFLSSVKGGLIAGIGIVLLFWTVIKVLGNIEESFNDIWGVKKGRSLGRKISDYLSIMLICPLLLIMASSLTVFVTSQVSEMSSRLVILKTFNPVIFFFLKLLPYVVVWIAFSFIYKFMPNTKISFKASILAGVIAGTLYQLVNWAYLFFQIGVAKYNAIYGSFAALPLFLIWLQVSWLVVLFGAEISFAVDNEEKYEFEAEAANTSLRLKRLLALRIVQLCEKNFQQAEKPLDVATIAHKLEAPIRLVRNIVNELEEANILSEVKGKGEEEERYQPAQDLENLTVRKVMDLLDKRGFDDPYLVKKEEIEKLSLKLDAMNQLLEKSPENVLLKDL